MDMAEKLALEDIRAMTDSRQPEKPTEASRAKIFPLALVAVLLSACYLICFEILFEKVYFFPSYGVVLIAFLAGVLGCFSGVVSLIYFYCHPQQYTGRPFAYLSILLFLWPIVAFAVHKFMPVGPMDPGILCSSNLRIYQLAIYMYADDNEGHLPPQENWEEALQPYLDRQLRCPSCESEHSTGYIYLGNADMVIPAVASPDHIPLLMDSEPRHSKRPKRRNVLFLDGHPNPNALTEEEVADLLNP